MRRLIWLVLLTGCGVGERLTGTKPPAKPCTNVFVYQVDQIPDSIKVCRNTTE